MHRLLSLISIPATALISLVLMTIFVRWLNGWVTLNSNPAGMDTWASNEPETYLKTIYPEIKSFAVQHLTLLSALLVFSVTFSEKVIDLKQAGKWPKYFLIQTWILLIAAMITDGVAIIYLGVSIPFSVFDAHQIAQKIETLPRDFLEPVTQSLFYLLLSGAALIIALISLVSSVIVKTLSRARP